MSQNVLERNSRGRRRGDINPLLAGTAKGGSQRVIAWAILVAFALLLGVALIGIS